MTTCEDLVAQYKAAVVNPSAEAPAKIEVVAKLSNHPSLGALRFLLEIISDSADYDLARIEALKAVQFLQPEHKNIEAEVANAVRLALCDQDELVQQWAAITAASYTDDPVLYEKLLALLQDSEQDLDVRHNCLEALRRAGPRDQAIDCLQLVSADAQLGPSARQLLSSWGSRPM